MQKFLLSGCAEKPFQDLGAITETFLIKGRRNSGFHHVARDLILDNRSSALQFYQFLVNVSADLAAVVLEVTLLDDESTQTSL